ACFVAASVVVSWFPDDATLVLPETTVMSSSAATLVFARVGVPIRLRTAIADRRCMSMNGDTASFVVYIWPFSHKDFEPFRIDADWFGADATRHVLPIVLLSFTTTGQ